MSEFTIITGVSGAGRSTAADVLEDIGWFVIDNLPPALIGKVRELVDQPGSEVERVAIVIGRAGGEEYLDDVGPALNHLRAGGARVRVLFLDASTDVLVRRFEDNRRRHPVAAEGVTDAIARERALLAGMQDQADVVVDTSDLNVHQLRDRIKTLFGRPDAPSGMQTSVLSFGFKHGVPLDADLVLDCRFLPNPHWIEELRAHSGLDRDVRAYVLEQPDTADFIGRLDHLLDLMLPAYVREGKSYLTIAFGCTGGHHRSVVLAEEMAVRLQDRGYAPTVSHRDIER